MNKKNELLEPFKTIITKRRTLRKFKDKKISTKTLKSILESISYCPSSFGLEPWKVVVIKNQKIKEDIKELCDNQEQAANCSHLLIVLSYKAKMFQKHNPWMIKRSKEKRNLMTDEQYLSFYDKRFMRYMKQINDWDQWSIRQSYILLQTILLSATAHGLASCPMEGINIHKIVNYLEINNLISEKEKGNFNCPYVVALGYGDDNYQPRTKTISNIKETFTIIN